MKRTFVGFILLVLFTICILLLSCSDKKAVDSGDNVSNTDFVAKQTFSFGIQVKDHIRLSLEGVSGYVLITGLSDTDSVIITGERRVGSESTEDAEEHLQQLEVSVQDLGNEVKVKTIQPEKTYGRSYVVDYNITLPKNFEVSVSNVSGLIDLDSINNYVSVAHVSGQIALNNISGSVFASLISGQIEGDVTLPLDGTISMSMISGSIELDIPQSTSASFSASVVMGSISLSDLVLKNQVSTPDSLSGTLGDGEGTISLSVVSGNISVSGF
ncbi:MAG: hypothetical protein AMJ90_07185 [candidate division Zixibacteria bacterium SM23_73_2]|nr:MAG: hypothetical protein AMJ90_07185 [candidate division Zixibacteria bacterium SM23_73_2]